MWSHGRRGALWASIALAAVPGVGCRATNPAYQGRAMPPAPDSGEPDRAPTPSPDAPRATADLTEQRSTGGPEAAAPDAPRPAIEAGVPDAARTEVANPASDVIGYWKFDEAPNAVSASDSSGLHNDAQVTRVGAGIVFVNGRVGNAADMGAETAWMAASSSPSFDSIGSQLTVAAWTFRRPSADPVHVIASRWQAQKGVALEIASGVLQVSLETPARQAHLFAMRDMMLQTWVHVAVTCDGMKVHLYIDGVESANMVWTDPIPNPTGAPVVIGGQQNGAGMVDRLFGGQIDELVIARRAFTAAEIASLARGNPPPPR
jgi:hypothetical protein